MIRNRKENSEENEGMVTDKERKIRTMTMRRKRRRMRRRWTTRMRRSRIGRKMLFWCIILRREIYEGMKKVAEREGD